MKALELDPEARYPSLAELIEELQEIELDLSISPPGERRRARAEPPPRTPMRRLLPIRG
jgi:hypothetical protein